MALKFNSTELARGTSPDNKIQWVIKSATPIQAAHPAPDANCVTLPDGECVSEKPCMHSQRREENKAVVAALPCFVCGPVCDPAKHQDPSRLPCFTCGPVCDPVKHPESTCPGCGQPSRVCAEHSRIVAPRYAGCKAWRGGNVCEGTSSFAVSRLDRVRGFQLRPPPQELLILADDQSEPP
jgi:hypothetical protein